MDDKFGPSKSSRTCETDLTSASDVTRLKDSYYPIEIEVGRSTVSKSLRRRWRDGVSEVGEVQLTTLWQKELQPATEKI
jgi:hypothetical protein